MPKTGGCQKEEESKVVIEKVEKDLRDLRIVIWRELANNRKDKKK